MIATEVKDKIDAFKEERIGSKRKGFVDTVQIEDASPAEDPMDLS